MPILNMTANVVRFELPSTKDKPEEEKSWVRMDASSLIIADSFGALPLMSTSEVTVNMLIRRIVEWNFTNEAGEPLEITQETISHLKIADINFLRDAIFNADESLDIEEKKTSSDTLSQSETVKVQVQ